MTDQPGNSNILDDLAAMERADTADMLGFVAGFSDQIGEGWRISRGIKLPWETPHSVAVLGMGGSAIGADMVKGIWADRLTVPSDPGLGLDPQPQALDDLQVVAELEFPALVLINAGDECRLSTRHPKMTKDKYSLVDNFQKRFFASSAP